MSLVEAKLSFGNLLMPRSILLTKFQWITDIIY